jgi:hypothetical protein
MDERDMPLAGRCASAREIPRMHEPRTLGAPGNVGRYGRKFGRDDEFAGGEATAGIVDGIELGVDAGAGECGAGAVLERRRHDGAGAQGADKSCECATPRRWRHAPGDPGL